MHPPNLNDDNDAGAVSTDDRMGRPALKVLRAGLVGRGIQGSLSPRMHEAEGARLGIPYEYRLFDFDELGLSDSDLPQFVAKLRRAGYRGFNVTHPFKERVVAELDRLSDDAAAVGAVNTVVVEGTDAVGYNTDCWGFAESLRSGLKEPRLDEVLLLGAGGAGAAVAKALKDLGTDQVMVFDSDRTKSARLVRTLTSAYGEASAVEVPDLEIAVGKATGLVNATPVGMPKYPGIPIDPHWLRREMWVADIIYVPAETELLRRARATGCQTLAGDGMAVFQATKAFELITGHVPSPLQMAHHFAHA